MPGKFARGGVIGTVAAATLVLGACSDQPVAPTPLDVAPSLTIVSAPSCNTARIKELLVLLYPRIASDQKDEIKTDNLVNNALATARYPKLLALAQRLVFKVIEVLKLEAVQAKLAEPPGPLTKEQAIAELSNLLLACVGLGSAADIPPGAFGPDGFVGSVDESGGDFGTPDNEIKLRFSQGTVDQPSLVYGAQVPLLNGLRSAGALAHTTHASGGPSCLVTTYDTYGNCYDIKVIPDPGALDPAIRGEICSLPETAHPAGSTPTHTVHERLRVAAQNPPGPIDILERLVPGPFALGHCASTVLADADNSSGALAGARRAAKALFAIATRPFRPTPLFAADGVGFLLDHLTLIQSIDPEDRVAEVEVFPASPLVATGSTVQLTPTRHNQHDGVIATPTSLQQVKSWVSSNPTVAQVDANGLVTANTVGEAVITVEIGTGQGADHEGHELTVTGSTSVTVGDPTAGAISNGMVSLGINPHGNLIVSHAGTPSLGSIQFGGPTTAVGIRYLPTNAEALATGILAEGWGISVPSGEVGYANRGQSPSTSNTTVQSFARSANRARSIVRVGSSVRVTHDFRPVPAASTTNLYEVRVTLENLSAQALTNVVYRRVLDWDIEPTRVQELVTVVGTAPSVQAASNGFTSADPTVARSGTPAPFFDFGPADIGAVFDYTIASIPAHGTSTFTLYFGAAGTPLAAKTAAAAVGAEVVSLARPKAYVVDATTPPGIEAGIENTFVLALAGVGGTPLTVANMSAPAGSLTPMMSRSRVDMPAPNPRNREP